MTWSPSSQYQWCNSRRSNNKDDPTITCESTLIRTENRLLMYQRTFDAYYLWRCGRWHTWIVCISPSKGSVSLLIILLSEICLMILSILCATCVSSMPLICLLNAPSLLAFGVSLSPNSSSHVYVPKYANWKLEEMVGNGDWEALWCKEEVLLILVIVVWWHIWKERNNIIFNGQAIYFFAVYDTLYVELRTWMATSLKVVLVD